MCIEIDEGKLASNPLSALSAEAERSGQVAVCCYCQKPLVSLFGISSPGLCGTIGCPGHKRRSSIDFPAMRCTGCGSALILRAGGGIRQCRACEREFSKSIPETYTKWVPQVTEVAPMSTECA